MAQRVYSIIRTGRRKRGQPVMVDLFLCVSCYRIDIIPVVAYQNRRKAILMPSMVTCSPKC